MGPQDPSDPGQQPDYTTQQGFQGLPTQEQDPGTYSDPAWDQPQAPDEPQQEPAPIQGSPSGRAQKAPDLGTEAANPGFELPDSAKAVTRRMTEAGYGPEQIAGALGCLAQESHLDNGSIGDGGTSFGLAQWHAGRATGLMQFANERNLDPYDADTQAQYMVHELQGDAASTGSHLRGQSSVAGAAHVWRSEFERPAQSYDGAASAAGSRYLQSVQNYVKGLRNGSAEQGAAQDGTANGTQSGTGGPTGDGTTLDPVSRVQGLVGGNATTAAPFIKAGGGTLDPRKDNWCAAFVNAALGQSGVRGSNSNVATSFMNWGQGVDVNDVQRNDVVVVPRGHGPGELGGHVGFATGGMRDAGGVPEVEVISGNTQHGHVAIGWYPANEVVIRRSQTADTAAQDPQGGGPNVQPNVRNTGPGPTYSVNGVTLPDFDHGGTVSTAAPMDPSSAAQYANANKSEGLGTMVSNFGGAIADGLTSLGQDLYGQGGVSHLINAGADYLGIPSLKWLTAPSGNGMSNAATAVLGPVAGLGAQIGNLAPGVGKKLNSTANKAIIDTNAAVDRVMGYDPNAPKGFMAELGYNAGLIAQLFGPSALSDVGAAAKAGGALKAVASLAGKAEKTAMGAATLTEGPELAKDITGSSTVGTAAQIGLPLLFGLRVPLFEKAAGPLSSILKGAGNYAKGLAGTTLAPEDALGALTPSQLIKAWDGGLRDTLNQQRQRAEIETNLAGNPRFFQDTGDPSGNLTAGSDLMAQSIQRTINDVALPMQKALWQHPDLDRSVMRDYTGANDTVAGEYAKFESDKQNFGRADHDFPSAVLDSIFKNSSPTKQVSTGVLDANGNPVMRTVSGTGQKGLGMINNLGSGIEARSKIEEAIRGLQAIPGIPGARSQIGILQRVSSSLLDDMSDLSNGTGGARNGTMRFYRGIGGGPAGAGSPGSGWLTTNPEKAALYGTVHHVDVTPQEAGNFALGGNGQPDEFFTDNQDVIGRLKPGRGLDPTAQAVAAFNRARTFSAALNDIRRDPGIAAVLDRGVANGKDAVDPVMAASQFVKGGPQGVAGLRQIQNLVEKTQGDPNNVLGLYKDMVRSQFAKAAISDGVTDPIAATRFRQRYGQTLDQLPDVAADVDNAIQSEQGVRQLLGKIGKVNYPDPTGTYARKAAMDNWLDAPGDAVLRAMDRQEQATQRQMMMNAIAQAKRDPRGYAFQGLRQEVINRALDGAGEKGSQNVLKHWADTHRGVIDALNTEDPGFGNRVAALTGVNTKAGALTALTDLGIRLLGTRLGTAVNHLAPGGGMAGGLSGGSWGVATLRNAFQHISPNTKLDVTRTLLNSQDAFEAFNKSHGMSLAGQAQDLRQQFNAASLLSSYLMKGALPAGLALQQVLNAWKRQNGDPNMPSSGMGWVPPSGSPMPQQPQQQSAPVAMGP